MRTLFTLCAFVISLTLTAQSPIKHVDAATFKKHIDQKNAVLIDLRTEDEIRSKGMIKGAMHLDFLAKDSETSISKLDKKKTYLIYCAGGGRSGDCAELMQRLGFKEIINLEKGFSDWKNKGYPIEKK